MTDLPTIRVGKHRGKPSFIWKINRKPRYRVIEQPDNKRAVNQQLQALLRELDEGPIAKTKRLPLAQHVADFTAFITAKFGKHRGDLLRGHIDRIVEATGVQKLTDLTVDKLEMALVDMKSLRLKRQLSDQSKNHIRATMRQFSRWLQRNKRTRELILEGLTLPEVDVKPGRRDRLQPDEADLLVTHAFRSTKVYRGYTGEQRAWLYRLALLTGLRRGELATLTPASFRIAEKVVVVAAGRTKNRKEARCPLPASVFPELLPWLAKHGPNQPLFPDLVKVGTNDLVYYDLRDAGIPYETPDGTRCFHSLRNTFISALWDQALPGPLVQNLARHSTMELTSAYNRHRDGARAAAIEGLPIPGMSRGESK